MKELQTVAKVQDTTPLAELGWYIDVEKIDNVYQWIVELHSFHTFEIKGKKLPLHEEMKKKGIKSVVLEIRFNKDFPSRHHTSASSVHASCLSVKVVAATSSWAERCAWSC